MLERRGIRTLGRLVAGLVWFCGVPGAWAAEGVGSGSDPVLPSQVLRDAWVWVEYDLHYDADGTAPQGIGWGEVCPNCGRIHGNPIEQRMREETAIRAPGFLVAADRVVTPDLQVHARFVQGITVVVGDERLTASVIAYREDNTGVLLALEHPVARQVPAFDVQREGPYHALRRVFLQGYDHWVKTTVSPDWTFSDDGSLFQVAPPASLIVDADGEPVGITLTGELTPDNRWKGDPLAGGWISRDELSDRQAELEERIAAGLVHVSLHFRSPQPAPGQQHHQMVHRAMHFGGSLQTVQEGATEHHAIGVVLDQNRVLVLAGLSHTLTARLERIRILLADGSRVSATFAGSLRDYQALVVTPEQPLEGALVRDTNPIRSHRNRLLLGADVRFGPSDRTVHIGPMRLTSFVEGPRNQIMPELVNAPQSYFLFADGQLVVMPIQRRDRLAGLPGQRSYRSSSVQYYPLVYWASRLGDLPEALDPGNRPLAPEEEQQVAWIGVELQPMDYDLALAHQVLHQTENGQFGAVVTHVYEGSPAHVQGIQVGDVFLRLHAENIPAPVQIRIPAHAAMRNTFQWEMLDRMPQQYLDQLPPPWPDAQSPFNRMLTQLGENTDVRLDLIRDGQRHQESFTLQLGPPSFASAPRYQHSDIGLTVRDLTYEVRFFLLAGAEDPGVIVSRVEQGGRANVAGIRSFELITHVDGEPIHNVEAFEQLMAQPGGKQLTLKRMAASRLVRLAE